MSQTKAQLIDNLVQPITGALGIASAPNLERIEQLEAKVAALESA